MYEYYFEHAQTLVPRPLPAAPYLVRRRYLIMVPRPLPAAPHCHVRRGMVTLAAMYLRRGGVVRRSFGRTYVMVMPRPVSMLDRYLRPRDAAAAAEEHSADEAASFSLALDSGAEAVSRGATHCASHELDCDA
jgi:hypothetical protein